MPSPQIKSRLDRFSQQDVRRATFLDIQAHLPDQAEPVTCIRALRVIQGKRMVCMGEWGTLPVIVKLYYDSQKAGRHYRKSLSGSEAFIKSDLPAPEILYTGTLSDSRIFIIIFQFLSNAIRLDAAFEQAKTREKQLSMKQLVVSRLAEHHLRGILQGDQHLGNFLIENETLYALDGDQVKTLSKPVSLRISLKNLAGFFAFFHPDQDRDIPLCLEEYCRTRGVDCNEPLLQKVKKWTERFRRKRLKQYRRKICMNRDPFVLEKTHQRFCVYDQRVWHREYEAIKDNPFAFFYDCKAKRLQRVVLMKETSPVYFYKETTRSWEIFPKKDILSRMWAKRHSDIRLGKKKPKPIMFLKIKTPRCASHSFLLTEKDLQD